MINSQRVLRFDHVLLVREIESTGLSHSDPYVLGNVVFQKKNPTITQDLSRRSIATSGENVSTYPRRPKAGAFSNAVDVVEFLHGPIDLSTECTAPLI